MCMRNSDATFSRTIIRLGEVEKYGTSRTRYDWREIMVKCYDDIILVILAPKLFMRKNMRQSDRAVIVRVVGIV